MSPYSVPRSVRNRPGLITIPLVLLKPDSHRALGWCFRALLRQMDCSTYHSPDHPRFYIAPVRHWVTLYSIKFTLINRESFLSSLFFAWILSLNKYRLKIFYVLPFSCERTSKTYLIGFFPIAIQSFVISVFSLY